MRALFAAALLTASTATTYALEGVSVEAHKVEARAGGFVRVLVTVRNDRDYLATVEISCGLFIGGLPSGEAHGFVRAIPPHEAVVGAILEKTTGETAKCRPIDVRKAE